MIGKKSQKGDIGEMLQLKNQTYKFIIITYLISWTIWIPLIFMGDGWVKSIGIFGPTVSALILTAAADGKSGLKSLLKKVLIWKVNIGWYAFSFASTLIVSGLALVIYKVFGGEVVNTNDPGKWYLIPVIFLYVLFFSVLGEEFGWRGFLLPRLQEKYNALTSSLIIGLVWGFWHLPLFFIAGDFHANIPFWLFLIQDIALAIIMTWIYNNTKKSLLLVHLFHAASNATVGLMPILPYAPEWNLTPLYITVALLILVSASIVIIYGPSKLTRN